MSNLVAHTTRVTCRSCGHSIYPLLDLGEIYLNAFVEESDDPKSTIYPSAPLVLTVCKNCLLVQLQHTANLDMLYRKYWYKSALNSSMVTALLDVVKQIEKRIVLKDGDTVIDIGCNDGTLLSLYSNPKLYKVGYDPALNLATQAKKHCDVFYNTYFGNPNKNLIHRAKVITSIAMFYDLEDPHTFVEMIKQSLEPEGLWVLQFTDLLSMLNINAFDNICHEHIEYYSFSVVQKILEAHGLEVVEVERNKVNGGSLRLYVKHTELFGTLPNKSVEKASKEEFRYMEHYHMRSIDPFAAFAKRVERIKSLIMDFLITSKGLGLTVFAMGASTKGNTLLQYFDITPELLPYAAEVNEDKFGKKTVGTNIPIISEQEALAAEPDYFLVLPWHFIDMLLEVHKPYLEAGGAFLVPMPVPTVYSYEDGELVSSPLDQEFTEADEVSLNSFA